MKNRDLVLKKIIEEENQSSKKINGHGQFDSKTNLNTIPQRQPEMTKSYDRFLDHMKKQ